MREIQKPIYRNPIRQFLGKEYYILKRKMDWIFGAKKWAVPQPKVGLQHLIFEHQSMILRPLKDVDMYLQENKRTNLALAIAHLDTIVIAPGETFSIWKHVGRPTKRKGYLEGLVLQQGQISKGIGGGLCQLGNLLFWIFAHSPLTITERYRHGFDVFPDVNRKVPFGAGATLSYNHVDLQVTNNTAHTFQIRLELDATHLHGSLFCNQSLKASYTVVERNHIIKQQAWGGYSRHNQIFRLETDDQGISSEELLVQNHAILMYTPFLN